MSRNTDCTVYIGNLDERVNDRVLYDILIQAGKLVDLYIPRDKENEKPKGYAFAEYETEKIADYAVRLFSGLVTLYNRTLKFAISGQDKSPQNMPSAATIASSPSHKVRSCLQPVGNVEISPQFSRSPTSFRVPNYPYHYSSPVPPPFAVTHQPNGYGSHYNGENYDYSRRVFGTTCDSITRSSAPRHFISSPISYQSY